ncbi:MAG: deoxyribodipyrimidine photo-lyase/cryptochrome family protein [Acidobacteriota bacterium]|nr:deoxyribodipyrimidine photo-lyase/cryptochrome family protein [Acidobacteriota bacterium]
MKNQLVWFKRDLRIEDHAPLVAAAARGPCIFLYVYEPEVIEAEDFDPVHLAVINESLIELETRLKERGAWLTFRTGRVPEVMSEIHLTHPIATIWSHQETGNRVTRARNQRLAAWAEKNGIAWEELPGRGVFRDLTNRDGWSSRWKERMKQPILEAPEKLAPVQDLARGRMCSETDFGLFKCMRPERLSAGESRAHAMLTSFLEERGEHYQSSLSSPVTAFDECSRLSLYLAYGNLSMKQVAQATWARQSQVRQQKKKTGQASAWPGSLRAFQARLHWRDHFSQKLEDQPDLEWANQSRAYDGIREDAFNAEYFETWCAGQTGYPMVDACMRALRKGGWINFRMRAMLMSFASYHLWLHWRPTALFLARQFIDYEPGIHYPQAQMQAGVTGINAIRIYSPTKQVKDHDPTGVFIRKYIPELAGVPDAFIAEPALMSHDQQIASSCVLGKDYPLPVVEHAPAVKRAKSILYGIRKKEDAREESRQVYRKHGSRRRPNRSGSKRNE